MKKFIAVVTSMAMAASLLTACGSNAASTETSTAAASEAASEKETAGKEAEETEPGAKTDGAASAQFQSSILFCGSTSLYPILSSLASSFTEKYVTGMRWIHRFRIPISLFTWHRAVPAWA